MKRGKRKGNRVRGVREEDEIRGKGQDWMLGRERRSGGRGGREMGGYRRKKGEERKREDNVE